MTIALTVLTVALLLVGLFHLARAYDALKVAEAAVGYRATMAGLDKAQRINLVARVCLLLSLGLSIATVVTA